MKGFRSDLWCELKRTLGAGSRPAYTLAEVGRGWGGLGGIKRWQEACVRSERWGMQLGHQVSITTGSHLHSTMPVTVTLALCNKIHHHISSVRSSLCYDAPL